jgi:serine/threonine-protein kinase RsbW
MADKIAARCETDLSPGSKTSPLRKLAGSTFITDILALITAACLDSNCIEPLTYIQTIVPQKQEFTLPSEIESIEEAAQKAEQFVRGLGFGDDFISAVDLAVRESVTNAVKHGNKFDKTKPVEVSFSGSGGMFEVTVRDFGTGFTVEDVPDPTDPENLLKVSGRGILFMRSFMDEVVWSNPEGGGLLVKMLKKQ